MELLSSTSDKKKIWKRKIFIIPMIFIILILSFILVTATLYIVGNNNTNAINNPQSTNLGRIAITNGSNDEVAYIDKGGNASFFRGYFSYLGSTTSLITKGWFSDIEASNSINSTVINASNEVYINNNKVSTWLYNQSINDTNSISNNSLSTVINVTISTVGNATYVKIGSANQTFVDITNITNFLYNYNQSDGSFNSTYATYSYNQSIQNLNFSFSQNLTTYTCSGTMKVTGIYGNGTVNCSVDQTTTDTYNISYDQHINNNTLHNSTFLYNQTAAANTYTDTRGFITSTIGNQTYMNFTYYQNQTTYNCQGTTKVSGYYANGTANCSTDQTGGVSGNPFDQTLNTSSNVRFMNLTLNGTIINISTFDASLKLFARSHTDFGNDNGESLELWGMRGESKPYIGWYGMDNGTSTVPRAIGWIGCHYNLTDGSVHRHCSWEVLDNSTGSPSVNSHFEIEYGSNVTRPKVRFPGSDVQFISLQKLYFGDTLSNWIYHNSVAGGLELNGTTVRLAANTNILNNSLQNVDDITSIAGNSIDLKPSTNARIYPFSQTTIGLSVGNDTAGSLTMTALGSSYFEFADRINVSSGLDICIGGGGACLGSLNFSFQKNMTSYGCSGTNKVTGFYQNGTVNCSTDQTGAGAATNPFDQHLNRTMEVNFRNITMIGDPANNNISYIKMNSSDGADNGGLILMGGGEFASSRGAACFFGGNEYTPFGLDGDISCFTGNTGTSQYQFHDGALGSAILTMDSARINVSYARTGLYTTLLNTKADILLGGTQGENGAPLRIAGGQVPSSGGPGNGSRVTIGDGGGTGAIDGGITVGNSAYPGGDSFIYSNLTVGDDSLGTSFKILPYSATQGGTTYACANAACTNAYALLSSAGSYWMYGTGTQVNGEINIKSASVFGIHTNFTVEGDNGRTFMVDAIFNKTAIGMRPPRTAGAPHANTELFINGTNPRLSLYSETLTGLVGFQFLNLTSFEGGLFKDQATDDLLLYTARDTSNPRLLINNSNGNVQITNSTNTTQICLNGDCATGLPVYKIQNISFFTRNNTVYQTINNLTIILPAAGYYKVQCSIFMNASVTTHSPQISANFSGNNWAFTELEYINWTSGSSKASNSVLAAGLVEAPTVSAGTTIVKYQIEGATRQTGAGTFNISIRGSVAGSNVTLMQGSFCMGVRTGA